MGSSAGIPSTRRAGVSSRALVGSVLPRLLLWGAGFVLVLWLAFAWTGSGTSSGSVHTDFGQNVWLPSRLVLDGVSPYYPSRPQVDLALGGYSTQYTLFNSGRNFHFIYPVWLALVFTPFATMPLLTATAVWRAVNLLLLVWGIGSVLRSSNPVFRVASPIILASVGITVLLAVTSRESILTLFIGQFSIVEFGLLAAMWAWLLTSSGMEGKRLLWGDALMGLALAILATKPQALGLPVLLLVLWGVSRRRWAIPVSAAVSLAALILGPLLFYPNSLSDWLSVVFAGGQASSQVEVSASVWGLSYQWLGASAPWQLVAGALSVVGLALMLPGWWRDLKDKGSPVPLSLPVALCINSVISPYMLGYEHVLLLFPALIYLAYAGVPEGGQSAALARDRKRWRVAIYTWMAVIPLLVVAVQGSIEREYPAIAQSASMLAICWVARLDVKRAGA